MHTYITRPKWVNDFTHCCWSWISWRVYIVNIWQLQPLEWHHMSVTASQITSSSIVFPTACSGWQQLTRPQCQALKFQIECTCPSGKWIVKITCPNVPFTCLKYIKLMPLMWKSEIHSHPWDKSCRYSTCATVIFTRLRLSDEWTLSVLWSRAWGY